MRARRTPTTPAKRPPMMRSLKPAVIVGAAVGAALFGALGWKLFGALGAAGGVLLGVGFGAVSGLDLLLPMPRRRSELSGSPGMGPFRGAVSFLGASVACALFGCYAFGDLTLQCRRADDGVRCDRVTRGWFGAAETGRQEFGPIVSVAEGRPEQIVAAKPDGERQLIDGFGEPALAELGRFLASPASSAVISGESFALWPPLLWGLGLVTLALGLFSLRKGVRMLREQFAAGEVAAE